MRKHSYSQIEAGVLKEHYLLFRMHARLANAPLAWIAHRCGLSANAVTLAGIALALPAVAFNLTGHFYWAIAVFHIFFVLDGVDGTLARATHTTSMAGAYLDDLGHYVFHSIYFVSLGFGLAAAGFATGGVLAVTAGLASALLRAHADLAAVRCPSKAVCSDDGDERAIPRRIIHWVVSTFHFPNILVILTVVAWQVTLMQFYLGYCILMTSLYLVHLSVRHASRLVRARWSPDMVAPAPDTGMLIALRSQPPATQVREYVHGENMSSNPCRSSSAG
jgi:phosphatidylglycerophosphate synthase